MELILERFIKTEECTVGRLSIINRTFDEYLGREDKEFICDTLEPPIKKMGKDPDYVRQFKSAMPPGRYPVVIRHSESFDLCLPLVVGVPKMTCKQVFFQIGSSVEEIEVGLIPGAYRGDGKMVASRNMIFTLKKLIFQAKERGEGVFLTVVRKIKDEK